MITTRRAKIIERSFLVTVECPECGELLVLEISNALGQKDINAWCELCDEEFKVNIFDYFAVNN